MSLINRLLGRSNDDQDHGIPGNGDTTWNASDAGAYNQVHEGEQLLEAGSNDRAEEAFRKALEINPNSARAHEYLGFVNLGTGSYADAQREFETAIRLSPYSPHQVRVGLGSVLGFQGKYEEALVALEPVLDDNPSPYNEAWTRRGRGPRS